MSFCTNIFIKPSLKYFILFLTIYCFFYNVSAQTTNVSGIINSYASVTSVGTQSISVTTTSGFAVGDKVLLIQMKGASIDTTNTSNFGTITSYNDAGNYEMLVISSITSTTITFTNPILRTYNITGLVQLVKVPVYNNVNVIGLLTCSPWNGSVGGILAFEATGNVTLNANIDVTGRGFLGGAKVAGQFLSCAGNTTGFKLPNTSLLSGNKGEGIVIIKPSFAKGLGALANGGGAGNDVNGGGAGGGNYGLGGHGGNSKCSTSPISLCGGREGKNCIYSNANNKIFLGGGGGAGHENDGVSTAGVAGGGIVIIRSGGAISGNGNFINANGNNNTILAGNDGQGGGGAGGTVLLEACSTSSLNISVIGGNGGADNFGGPDCHGKGGGGGGGIIWTSSSLTYTSFLNGGNPGVFNNSNSQCFNTSNGATAGQVGGTLTGLSIPGATSLVSNSSFSINTSSNCFGGGSSTAIGTISTTLVSPVVSYIWSNSSGVVVSQTNNTTSLIDSVTNLTNGIYTLSVSLSTPCSTLSGSQTLTINCVSTPTQSCGGSLQFNNINDAVILPTNNQIYSSNGFTWECWFKLNTPFASNPRGLIMTEDPVVYEDIFLGFGWSGGVGNFPTNHLGFKVDGPNSTTGPSNVSCDYMPPGGFLLGTWYHAAGVMDYTTHTAKLYLNGVLVDTKTVNSDPFSRSIQSRLSDHNISAALGGNEDEVRIWQKVRTASEILSDYNQCLSGNETDLLMYYRCNQSSGSTVFDATVNGNDGNLINSTSWSTQQPVINGSACSGMGTFSLSISSSCNGGNSTATGTVITSIPSPTISYTWTDSSGNIVGQTSNSSSLTNVIANLPNGVYTFSVQLFTACGSVSNTQTVNINCTSTSTLLCSGTLGTPIFFEDFGSGASLYGPALPPGVTNYTYLQGVPNNGTYVIASSSNPSATNAGYVNDNHDHTGNPNGYMMVVNSDYSASEVYRKHVTGLCPGTTYVFSAYLANNNSPDAVTNVCGSSYVYANIKFQTEFPVGTILNSTTSGNLAVASNSVNLPWIQYGFAFTTAAGQTSADVVLVNNAPGGCGNDYVVDDISLAPCGPGVGLSIVPNNTVVCPGSAVTLQSNFTSGSYTSPQYQWQFSNDGGLTWTDIAGATSQNYNITSVTSSQAGMYQLLVSEAGNISLSSCRIVAGPLTFSVSNGVSVTSPSVAMCAGSNTTLTVTGANTYTWSNSATLSSSTGSMVIASPNVTTSYTVTGANSACTNTAIVTVNVNPSPTITAVSINNTSCGLANGSATITSLPASNIYSWSSGITSIINTASALSNGNYTVTAISGACQTSTVISILGSVPLSIVGSTITPTHCNVNDGSISVSDNLLGSSYGWNPSVSSSSNASNLGVGSYSLTITNGACSTSSVFVVSQLNGPTALTIVQNNAICESSGSIKITNVINGVSPYQYSFNNSGFSSITTYTNLSQGIYTVTIKDADNCLYTQTLSITQTTINSSIALTTNAPNCESDDGVFIIDSITGGTPPYVTSFNNTAYSSNMTFEQLSTGTYTLSILDSNLCETGFLLTMPENNKDYTLYIPNTFTPNKDKINDIWFVQGTCLGEFSCLIYNRWGEKIKELRDIKEGWDGTFRGVSVPDGVYVYLVEVSTKEGIINKAGHITVFR